ncbi:MAG: hypothetical protein R3D62_00110 [Xanthobacteraceae bacterium]
MTNVNGKVYNMNDITPAGKRAGAPILLTEQDLEAVAAAGSKPGSTTDGRSSTSQSTRV